MQGNPGSQNVGESDQHGAAFVQQRARDWAPVTHKKTRSIERVFMFVPAGLMVVLR